MQQAYYLNWHLPRRRDPRGPEDHAIWSHKVGESISVRCEPC